MPSRDELNLMNAYFNNTSKGGFKGTPYWSSELSPTLAWWQDFFYGSVGVQGGNNSKADNRAFRPARAF